MNWKKFMIYKLFIILFIFCCFVKADKLTPPSYTEIHKDKHKDRRSIISISRERIVYFNWNQGKIFEIDRKKKTLLDIEKSE
jgi:hypothetical protein